MTRELSPADRRSSIRARSGGPVEHGGRRRLVFRAGAPAGSPEPTVAQRLGPSASTYPRGCASDFEAARPLDLANPGLDPTHVGY